MNGQRPAFWRNAAMRIILSARDEALLRLLDRTPATTTLILKASESFPGDAFHDERRVRERLQALAAARFVRAFPATHGVGGPINWYKLTAEGYRWMTSADLLVGDVRHLARNSRRPLSRTPRSCSKTASRHQKQPPPRVAK